MIHGPLTVNDIRRLFGELAAELEAVGQRAEIFLVSGPQSPSVSMVVAPPGISMRYSPHRASR
jgi:hypothetical protein